jgi:hypothetical protein
MIAAWPAFSQARLISLRTEASSARHRSSLSRRAS